MLIVSGKVDDDLVLQLHSAKIAVLQGTGANILEIISNATGVSLASYIADCDMVRVH